MKIAMVSVFVEDPAKAHAFYTEKLGFVTKMAIPEAMLYIVASPEEPESTGILLEPVGDGFAKTYQDTLWAKNLPCITFGTSDIQADHDTLSSRGVVFRKPPTKQDWGIESVFEDTCGNLIQLVQV